jgi:hypothetical protein
MSSTETPLKQDDRVNFSPLGRHLHQRFAYIAARERLLEARELLAEGAPIAAAQGIDAAVDDIEDAGRKELAIIEALTCLPPVWRIDAALNARREPVLDGYAKQHGWRSSWTPSGYFMAADENGDFNLEVSEADAWRCSSGVPDMMIGGTGLTSLLAHLRGETIDLTVKIFAAALLKGAAR